MNYVLLVCFFLDDYLIFVQDRNLCVPVPENSLIYLLLFKWRNRIFITKSSITVMNNVLYKILFTKSFTKERLLDLLYSISQNSICL